MRKKKEEKHASEKTIIIIMIIIIIIIIAWRKGCQERWRQKRTHTLSKKKKAKINAMLEKKKKRNERRADTSVPSLCINRGRKAQNSRNSRHGKKKKRNTKHGVFFSLIGRVGVTFSVMCNRVRTKTERTLTSKQELKLQRKDAFFFFRCLTASLSKAK